jgi:DNA-binding response OmpR family regulator
VRPLNLTPIEREILKLFLQNPGRVLSRERILNRVWSVNRDPQTNIVDVYVRRLRQKLGTAGSLIETVRGAGYRCAA